MVSIYLHLYKEKKVVDEPITCILKMDESISYLFGSTDLIIPENPLSNFSSKGIATKWGNTPKDQKCNKFVIHFIS